MKLFRQGSSITMDTQNLMSVAGSVTLDSSTMKFYTQELISGKGQGLVATQDIPRGTRILAEKPLFKIPVEGTSPKVVEMEIANKLKLLSKDELRAFLSLRNNVPGTSTPFLNIVRTNSLPLGHGSQTTEGGVFLEVSRINHACLPNCQHTWNTDIGQETIHAVKDIHKGEELTITYLYNVQTYAIRQQHLKDSFDFTCSCQLCSLSEEDRAISDKQILQMEHLNNAMLNAGSLMNTPHLVLKDAHALLLLLQTANIADTRLARLYYEAYQIVIVQGDVARGTIFAEKAHKSILCCEGEDSPQTKRMKAFAEEPKGHNLYGIGGKWRTNVKNTPKVREGEEFERWLWRNL